MITNRAYEIKLSIDFFDTKGNLICSNEQQALAIIAGILRPIIEVYGGYTITKGLGSYYNKEKGIITHLNTIIITINDKVSSPNTRKVPASIEKLGNTLAREFHQKEVLINVI